MARMKVGLLESLQKFLNRLESLESDNEVEMLIMELRLIEIYYFKFPYFDLSPHLDKIINNHIRFVEDQILHSLLKKTSIDSQLVVRAKYVNERIWVETHSRHPKLSHQILHAGTNMSDGNHLVEFMDSHIEILNYITRACFIPPLALEEIIVLKNKLRLLRDFHSCKASGNIQCEKLEYLSTQVQTMAYEIAHLCFTFWAEFNKDCINLEQVFRIICEIELIEPELQEIFLTATRTSLWSHSETSTKIKWPDVFTEFLWRSLTELQNSMACSIFSLNAQILKEIDILKSYLKPMPTKDVLACIASLINEARVFVHKIKDKTINAVETQLALSDILEKIVSRRKQIEEIRQKIVSSQEQISDKPVTDGLFSIQNLLHNLNSLMASTDNSLASVKHQTEIIHKELVSLTSSFKRKEHECLTNLRARAVGLAYDAEYAIHLLRLNGYSLRHHLILDYVIREIRLIKTEVTKLLQMMPDIPTPGNLDNLVVGFEKETQTIINKLTRGPEELDVISITGMAGLGKTTLAKKVYTQYTFERYFDVRAWCCVSQEYDLKDLMHNIYSQVIGCKNQKQEDDIAEKLKKNLSGNRYLIVLDDIWTTKAWDELSIALPNDRNGSRIILTTREDEVASYAKLNNTNPMSLPFLTIEESWLLLHMRLFKGRRCPQELVDVGRQIAEKCGGLPLVVVLVAGLLEGVQEKASQWLNFVGRLGSHIKANKTRSRDVIEFSYERLPEHLKKCFLYFGAFPEDYEIPVSKLIQLWMAEEFVVEQPVKKKSLEDEAEEYLKYLIRSNLVIVSSRGYNGNVKTCRVHDLVFEFCSTKAKEKIFLQSMNPGDGSITAYESTRRFCFHKKVISNDLSLKSWMSSWNSSIQTIMCYVLGERYYSTSRFLRTIHNGSWVAYKLKLLKVLDLESIVLEKSFLDKMHYLIHLRYLAIHLQGRGSVSLSLWGLSNLQTFKVKSNSDLHLPYIFSNVGKLRHLHIDHYCSLCQEVSVQIQLDENYENLQTFTTSILTNHIREKDTLMRLPNLRKLSCRFSESHHNQLPELDFLRHLECLEASYYNEVRSVPCQQMLKLPSSLKQLTIRYFRLAWSNISTIASLPNLEALEIYQAFEGEEWNVGDCTFPKLKFLKLRNTMIARWVANTDESFPVLEQLVLVDCRYLQGVPLSFGSNSALQVIEVKQCNRLVASSVKQIQEELTDLGNEHVNVCVWKSDSEPKKWYNL